MPKLWYLFGDCVWHNIAESLDALYYIPEMEIYHDHFLVNKESYDKISEVTNSKETYNHDMIEYTLWNTRVKDRDIKRIKENIGELGLRPKKAGF
jgi:hypothetical protein